jgi:uncharacterized protein (DUF983 family)
MEGTPRARKPPPDGSGAPATTRVPLLRSIARALRRRCPNCGVDPVMRSWFTISPCCSACGLRFERGRDEEHDYWLGAYMLNFIVTEVVFAVGLLIALLATWPDPPWHLLLYGGGALMVLTPIIFYPFSKSIWLAIDLVFRPAQPEDFAK